MFSRAVVRSAASHGRPWAARLPLDWTAMRVLRPAETARVLGGLCQPPRPLQLAGGHHRGMAMPAWSAARLVGMLPRGPMAPVSRHALSSARAALSTAPRDAGADAAAAQAADAGGSEAPVSPLKRLVREYGVIVFVLYMGLAFLVYLVCLSAITFAGVDQAMIEGWLDRAKRAFGLDVPTPEERAAARAAVDPQQSWVRRFLPASMQSEAVVTFVHNSLLAMVMTKLFFPIKLAITAAAAPRVSRWLRRMGFNLGQQGVRNTTKDARARVSHATKGARTRVQNRVRDILH